LTQGKPFLPETTQPNGQRNARIVMAFAFVVLGVWTLKSFLPALAWAAILAIALWPLYRWAQTKIPPGKHNILLPLLITTGFGLIFAIPLAIIGIKLAGEAHAISQWAQDAQAHGIKPPDALGKLPFGGQAASHWWDANLNHPKPASGLLEHADSHAFADDSREVGAALLHRLTLFGFTLLTLFVLLREGHDLTAQLRIASRRAFGDSGERVGGQMIASIHGTVTGLVFVGLAEGAILGVAYAIAGVPHPVALGALSAIAAILPFGATVAAAIAALLLAATGSVVGGCVLFAFGSALAFATDHFVRPVLIGGATKLPFLWVLLGILGGLEVWGLLGLFVGPAIMAALILLWRDWVSAKAP
jgi:predicted PurR-regulated permease PerM